MTVTASDFASIMLTRTSTGELYLALMAGSVVGFARIDALGSLVQGSHPVVDVAAPGDAMTVHAVHLAP